MAQFKFEGNFTDVRKPQLDFISSILEKRGYNGSKVVFEAVGKEGDNYMADVRRIVVEKNGEYFKMIAKLAQENEIFRQATSVASSFANEEFAYTVIMPKFQQKLKLAGVPESEGIRFPKCYGATLEAPNEVILLEDLKPLGFSTFSRTENLPDEGMKLVLRYLAIYHSLSFVLRYQEPETFASFQKKLEYLLDASSEVNDNVLQFFQRVENQCLEVLENDKHKQIVKSTIPNFSSSKSKINKMIKISKYSVIQHGDAWITNVMYRFENEVPKECIMIDYQTIKENSPVSDIMSIIFNSSSHQQRLVNFNNYIDHYHSELDKSLNNFGLKANFVYPRDRLDAELKIHAKLMIVFNIISARLVTRNTDDAVKLKDVMDMANPDQAMSKLMTKDDDTLDSFKQRVEGLIDSYCEFGLI